MSYLSNLLHQSEYTSATPLGYNIHCSNFSTFDTSHGCQNPDMCKSIQHTVANGIIDPSFDKPNVVVDSLGFIGIKKFVNIPPNMIVNKPPTELGDNYQENNIIKHLKVPTSMIPTLNSANTIGIKLMVDIKPPTKNKPPTELGDNSRGNNSRGDNISNGLFVIDPIGKKYAHIVVNMNDIWTMQLQNALDNLINKVSVHNCYTN